MKKCNKCLFYKSIDEFYRKKDMLLGVTAQCKSCIKKISLENHKINRCRNLLRMTAYRNKNIELARLKDRQRYALNPEKRLRYVHEWRSKSPEKYRAAERSWRKRNKEIKYTIESRRRAAKLNAVPKWLSKEDLLQIREIYKNCPKGYHVDHIIPLQGVTVCGLHVPWNLQYLPAKENLSKGRRVYD